MAEFKYLLATNCGSSVVLVLVLAPNEDWVLLMPLLLVVVLVLVLLLVLARVGVLPVVTCGGGS